MANFFDDNDKELEMPDGELIAKEAARHQARGMSKEFLNERENVLFLEFAKATVAFLKAHKDNLEAIHQGYAYLYKEENEFKFAYHTALMYAIRNIDIFPEVMYSHVAFLPFGEDIPHCFNMPFPFYAENEPEIERQSYLNKAKDLIRRLPSMAKEREETIMDCTAIMEAICNIIPWWPGDKKHIVNDSDEEILVEFNDYGNWEVDYNGEKMHLLKFIDRALSGKL